VNTVCAVAQRINPTGKDDEVILGALNYTWFDQKGGEYLLVEGKTLQYTNGKLTPATVPAQEPAAIWDTALERWNEED
jgi:hypothetical protein